MRTPKKILVAVFLLTFFIRLYHLQGNTYFSASDEVYSFLVRQIALLKHFPLISAAAADTGIYMGPLFLYLGAIPFALFKLNPIGGSVTSAFIGGVNAVLLFYLLFKLKSPRVSIFASILYASSSFAVIVDQHFWNVTPIPLTTLFSLFCLYKIIAEKKDHFLIFLSIAISVALQSNLSSVTLLMVVLFFIFKKRKLIRPKVFLISIVVLFILNILPLIFFDIRHGFKNTRALLNNVQDKKKPFTLDQSLMITFNLFENSAGRLIYKPGTDIEEELSDCQKQGLFPTKPPAPINFLLLVTLIFIFVKLVRRKSDLIDNFLVLLTVSTFVLLVFWRNYPHEHYFYILSPVVFITTANLLGSLSGKVGRAVGTVAVLFLALINLSTIVKSDNKYGLAKKINVVEKIIKESNGQPFSFYSYGPCHNYGFRYLFTYLGNEPEESGVDYMYAWLYDSKKKRKPVIKAEIFTPGYLKDPKDENLERTIKEKSYKTERIDNINVYYSKYN